MRYGCVLLVLAALSIGQAHAHDLGNDVIELSSGWLRLMPGDEPPPRDGQGQAVALPDVWPLSRYAQGDNGWYRFLIQLDRAPQQAWGIYLPRVNMNAAVRLNGIYIGDGGRFDEPMARNWTRPLYFPVSPHILRAGQNVLDVRLKSYPGYGLLNVLYAGPESQLMPFYERHAIIQEDINGALFFATLTVGLFMLGLWLRRRRDTMYLWFALAALAWSLYALNSFVRHIPVSARAWDWLVYSSTAWWTVLLAVFARRVMGRRWSRLELAFWAWALLSTVVYGAIDASLLSQATSVLQLGSIVVGGIVVWQLLMVPQQRRRETTMLGIGIALVLATGVHDWLVQSQFIGAWWFYGSHILHYSAPFLILFVGWHLSGRFIRALNESEALNIELEDRVAAARRQLAQSYRELHVLEQQRAIVQERDRIYRDLHDDVGAKLLSLVYRSKDEAQSELARSALRDLRDVVSRSVVDERSLSEALADWRAECSDRLDHSGVALQWEECDPIPACMLSPQQAANLGRTLREALSNALHHGEPQSLRVQVGCTENQLAFQVWNDGARPSSSARSGQGLSNMQRRIQELGGSIEWRHTPASGEHLVSWQVPLGREE